MLNGIGVSNGIAIGKVVRYVERSLEFDSKAISDVDTERRRFGNAVGEFCRRVNELAGSMDKTAADGQILRGYLAMINDPYLTEIVFSMLENGASVEEAVTVSCDKFIKLFTDSADELVRHRAADIEDIKRQMLEILLGVQYTDLKNLPQNTILVTKELTPSMTVGLENSGVVGIIAEKGGRTSHSAIISRSFGIPTVLGVKDATEKLCDSETVALDGETGEIYKSTESGAERLADKKKNYIRIREEQYTSFFGKPSVMADGKSVTLMANIDSPRDIEAIVKNDAEGVGLFRTEGFFLDRGILPTEDEQYKAYRSVAEAMNGKRVVIRTLDVGGDKKIPTLRCENEDNPFLGLRAIRYSIKNQGLFRTQLRAILKASAYGNVSLMIPLVTRADEIIYVKNLLERLKAELDSEGVPYNKDIKVGVMIETPAACAIVDILAQYADFFSIGTNDLIGYAMAVDRGNPDVSYLYSAYEPAVLRMIRFVVQTAIEHGVECSMCGEVASDERFLPLLLSFGLRSFSVNPSNILNLRARLSELRLENCEHITQKVMEQERARNVENTLVEK
ncbi:MAG: phosphoenolpyruvate--protein phosphotransferase [Clostridia bacterium]|nr:phosphoenolpyruvate--protein phosphotransferase [Clostridia bacterium]